jgi:cytochrome b involved in lipid metabolism
MFEFLFSIYCKIDDDWYNLNKIVDLHPGGYKFIKQFHLRDITDNFYLIPNHKYINKKVLEQYKVNDALLIIKLNKKMKK